MSESSGNYGFSLVDVYESTEKVGEAVDDLIGTKPTSALNKIDKELKRHSDSLKHPIPTVYATYVETVDGVDYYTAASDEITELYDKLIILLQLNRDNTGKVVININAGGNIGLMKTVNGINVDLYSGELNKGVGYLFQYSGSKFSFIGILNAKNIALCNPNFPNIKTVDEGFSSLNEKTIHFAPFIYGATTPGMYTYVDQSGICNIRGNTVVFKASIRVADISNPGTGVIRMGGFPFVFENSNIYSRQIGSAQFADISAWFERAPSAVFSANSNFISFSHSGQIGLNLMANEIITNTAQIHVQGAALIKGIL